MPRRGHVGPDKQDVRIDDEGGLHADPQGWFGGTRAMPGQQQQQRHDQQITKSHALP
jgi:hypothetical protein